MAFAIPFDLGRGAARIQLLRRLFDNTGERAFGVLRATGVSADAQVLRVGADVFELEVTWAATGVTLTSDADDTDLVFSAAHGISRADVAAGIVIKAAAEGGNTLEIMLVTDVIDTTHLAVKRARSGTAGSAHNAATVTKSAVVAGRIPIGLASTSAADTGTAIAAEIAAGDRTKSAVRPSYGKGASATITTTNTDLTDTAAAWTVGGLVGATVVCNGKSAVVLNNTATVATVAAWSGGGNPGNGHPYTIRKTEPDSTVFTAKYVTDGTTTCVLLVARERGAVVATLYENMTNAAWDVTTTGGGQSDVRRNIAAYSRAATAGEVAQGGAGLGIMYFPLDFNPTIVVAKVRTAAGAAKAWDGDYTVVAASGSIPAYVVVGNGGTTDWVEGDIVQVLAVN